MTHPKGSPLSAVRVLLVSWWVLLRMQRAALRMRLGGGVSSLLNVAFFIGVAVQTGGLIHRQVERAQAQLASKGHDALSPLAGQLGAVFLLDVVGLLVLLPPAMIRADGVAGRQRAAVDTELWLTLPLSGTQRVMARLGQATFFLTFLALFLLSHFLAPAIVFSPSRLLIAPLFAFILLLALLVILGGGMGLYALARRFLPPSGQGQMVAWTGLGLLPLGYAFFALSRGEGGALGTALGKWMESTPLPRFLRAFYEQRAAEALLQGGILLGGAALFGALGWQVTRVLGAQAADDLLPLSGARRYPSRACHPLSFLGKDLLLRLRDPTHRGALIASVLSVLMMVVVDAMSGGMLMKSAQAHRGEQQVALSLGCFAVGMAVLISSGQWMSLEARAFDWLRASGMSPTRIVYHKGLCAMVEAIVLSLPLSLLLALRSHGRMVPALVLLWLFSAGLAWFMVGDSAARFPYTRRDTRPVNLRSLYAGYLVMLPGAIALPHSISSALTTLVLLGMGALGRVDAGIDALHHLDEDPRTDRRVRFADAWLPGAAAVLTQVAVVVLVPRLLAGDRLPKLTLALLAYAASAILLGLWSAAYLVQRRADTAPSLFAPPRGAGYLAGVLSGLLSAAASLGYVLILRRLHLDPGGSSVSIPGWQGALAAIAICVLAPIAEEIFFRGFLLRGLIARLGSPVLAVGCQALLFMVLHPTLSYAPVLLLGLLTGALVLRTGSLWPGILCHALHNAAPLALLLLGRRP